MILFDLTNSEGHPAYQTLAISNGDRQFQFLESIILAAVSTGQFFLSQAILKALNYHAIACLHTNPGQVRPCNVRVGPEGDPNTYYAPDHFRVDALMEDFVNKVNAAWHQTDADILAAFVLWRLCGIHPFINGNGRTARAAAYFVICVKAGGLLPGNVNLTKLLKDHPNYTAALKYADATFEAGALDLGLVVQVVRDCIAGQLASAVPHEDKSDGSGLPIGP